MKRKTLTQILAAAVMLTPASITPARAAELQDHPLITRFAGSRLVRDSSVVNFDEYPLVTGPFRKGKFPQVQKIEGRITILHYMNPEGRSTLEVFRSYQNALKQAGFTTIFTCSDRECGDPANDDTNARWFGRWCAGIAIQCPEPMRYAAAKLTRPTGDVYVAVKVRTNGVNESDGTHLNIIEPKPMESQTVKVNPSGESAPQKPATVESPAPVRRVVVVDPKVESRHALPIPAATEAAIRMIDSIDSEKAVVGQTFRASLDAPISDAQGNVLVPRGADATVKLVNEQQSGKFTGRAVLTLTLVSIKINGREVEVRSADVVEQSGSRGKRSIALIGGGGVAGAAIGALTGRGKGAAIGAASGAAAGTVVELVTKGQRVRVAAEARLVFKLQQEVRF